MSSKRRERRRSCTYKKRHETRSEAKAEARRIGRTRVEYYCAYKCRYCGGYHVGRVKQKRRGRRRY